MIGTIVYTILSTDSDTNTSVGGRIYPFIREQVDALPAIVYLPITRQPLTSKDITTTDIRSVQVSVLSEKQIECETIAEYVRAALDFYKGTVATKVIEHVEFENDRSRYEEDAELFRIDLDFNFWVKR